MKVALTGGSGFVGREIARQLKLSGFNMIQLIRESSRSLNYGEYEYCRVNYNNLQAIKASLVGCDAILHCAGRTSGSDKLLKEANITLTKHIIEALPESVKRIVYISSAAAGMNKGYYGESKREAEFLLIGSGRDTIIFRPTLIYGPGDTKNVQVMINWIKKSPFVPVFGGGGFMFQPVHVEDVASVATAALTSSKTNTIYNVCGPQQIPLRTMLEELKVRTGSNAILVPVPLKPVQKILKLWSMIWPATKLPVKQVLELDKHVVINCQSTLDDLSFSPRKFQDGLDWIN